MTPTEPVTAADLWTAVDALLKPRRIKLPKDGIFDRWTTLPPLWVELTSSIDKNTGDSGNGKQQSRPPLNTEAISLTIEIAQAVRVERRRRKLPSEGLDTPKELRAVIRDVIAAGDVKVYPDVPRSTITWWPHMRKLLTSWAARIRAITDHDTMRLYGTQCRTCRASSVPAFNPDGSENGRQPALVVHFIDGEVTRVACDMCGATIDDDGLNKLWHDANAEAARALKEKSA